MELISAVTVGSGGAASIDFTSIPATFTDLMLYVSARSTLATTTAALNMRFNGQVAAVYSTRRLYGTGSSVASNQTGNQFSMDTQIYIAGANTTANTFANFSYYIPNYTGNTNKIVSVDGVSEQNGATAYQGIESYIWSNTAAITQITLLTNDNFAQYTTAYLYGILKGSGGATVS